LSQEGARELARSHTQQGASKVPGAREPARKYIARELASSH